jgi:2-oxoglutarate/2-oxoacid ferredoxin oxidoreductase subunit alpha
MKDLNIVISGAAGEGVQTIGDVLADTVSAHGYAVFTWQEYESRIRGGQNSYSIRIGETAVNAPLEMADILLALNDRALSKYAPLLKEDGTLLAEQQVRERMIAVPFNQIAQDELGDKIFANTVALGALAATAGMELNGLRQTLKRQFADKGDRIVQANLAAAEKGYRFARERCRDMCPWQLPERIGQTFLIAGNEAIPIAAAHAGCRFIAAYPMTPSTGIITLLSREQQLGVFAEQAEDEIAAINMAIGASFAGVRAMTATSGGGFALMVEGVSLAGMTETPVVIVLAQRPGPATGLPTRTAQGELLFAVNAGHGEFPKLVLAPSDPKDAFHKMVRAFDLADKYQIPVIVLTDQFLADSRFTIEDFELEKLTPTSYLANPSDMEHYQRYQSTASGISARLYPGQSRHLVGADSDEHDAAGHITEDLTRTVVANVEKRITKLNNLKREIQPPEATLLEDADVVLVGWGSSRAAIHEGCELLREAGVQAGALHFTELWPLPDYSFPGGKRYWTVESNATGQLARLLRSEYGLSFRGSLVRVDGLPLTGDYIRRCFHDH